MHWIIIGMKPANYLKLFWTIVYAEISLPTKSGNWETSSVSLQNEEICSDGIVYNIRNSFCVYITIRITSACDSQVNGSYVMS